MNIEDVTADIILAKARGFFENILIISDIRKRSELFTDFMEQARKTGVYKEASAIAFECAIAFKEAELWELPKSFDKEITLQSFPVDCLPAILRDYLSAVSESVQVYPEIAVLPLMSVLSLCVQGKAVVRHPGSNHTESLNLYTITVGAPGERKSSSFSKFVNPVEIFQENYNNIHKTEIEQYKTEKAFFEQQKKNAMTGKNANLEKAKEIAFQLSNLEEKNELRLNINDVTPEALAWEMYRQGGRLGVVDDEGSIFDILSGLYSSGNTNINIFLKAYDGSNYTIVRRTKEDIVLKNPLLTMGIMTQPDHFLEAMNNKQFIGRGFIHRFLFSFPANKAGNQKFRGEEIPFRLSEQYKQLIFKLLSMPYPNNLPVMSFDNEAYTLLKDYYEHIQKEMQEGGMFYHCKEWASKQFARCLKITAILHLCEHDTNKLIAGNEAFNGINISVWCENQALKAFSGGVSDSFEIKAAKRIYEKLKKHNDTSITKRELLRMCRTLKSKEIEEPLEILEDMNIIKREIISNNTGRTKEIIKISPLI